MVKDFLAFNDWIGCFRKRYNVVQKKVCREKLDVNKNVIKDWKEKMLSLFEIYSSSNIYNTDCFLITT